MVAMVASASGYGTLRRFLSAPEGQQEAPVPSASIAVSSKQRASIKWLLSKAFNNRVPDNLQEPFYRDHEDQEHLKPPIVGGLANAELYCLALANMYSEPNYHSLNHWNILQTMARKGVTIVDPPDCPLTETQLIQNNPLRMSAHMTVIESLMSLYAREVVTLDRVAAAAQRFGAYQPPAPGSGVPHEDGLVCWVNAAAGKLNEAEPDPSSHVPMVKNLQDMCDGTALAALISFYCPDALPRSQVRVGRMVSIQDCLHNLMLVHRFCSEYLPHNIFHMLPEDVTYMRGSMRQNLIAMLADLFNMLEVHPVKCVKNPTAEAGECNEHGVRRSRRLPPPPPLGIPDLRPGADLGEPFAVARPGSGAARRGRSACSTPERRSCSPQREHFVVHRGRGVTTLATVARLEDADPNLTAAGRPSNYGEVREVPTGRRSRRSSISDDSQLTVENFGGSQERLHFAGRHPAKELATVGPQRKISAPAGPVAVDYNPPLRSSRQDIRGSIQFFHGDFQNGSSHDDKPARQNPQTNDTEPYYPIKRQLSSDAITLKQNYSSFSSKGGGDGFFLNNRDSTDGDASKMSFADVNRGRSNGDQGHQQSEVPGRKALQFSPAHAAPPAAAVTTWQQQYMQQELQPNGDDALSSDDTSAGGAMAAQLNNIRLKLEEKRRRIEQDKHRMELAVNRQRQQLGQQAFLQAVTRDIPDHQSQAESAALEQYHQSIAKMNSSLQDIQSDIARLASQQSALQQQQQTQLQQQQQTALQQQQSQLQHQLAQLQQQQQAAKQLFTPPPASPFQPPLAYQPNIPQLHSQFSSQHNVSRLNTAFGSTPHIPDYQPDYRPDYQPDYRDVQYGGPGQFYLHEAQQQQPQRRTWAQHAQINQENAELRGWQLHQQQQQTQQQQHNQQQHQQSLAHAPEPPRWASPDHNQGFVLHDRTNQPFQVHYNNSERFQNGTDQNHLSYTVINNQQYSQSPPNASPIRRAKTPQRQGSLPEVRRPESVSLQQLQKPQTQAIQDDMEPQNISFIGNAEDDALRQGINRLNISSGTRTYRIPSPTRPSLNRNSFQQMEQEEEDKVEKGFYISFDNEAPKRPKPPLRAKRMSPKKERNPSEYQMEFQPPERRSPSPQWEPRLQHKEEMFPVHRAGETRANDTRAGDNRVGDTRVGDNRDRMERVEPAALVIGDNPDPKPKTAQQNSAEEMERKKERIMLLSLQRRQRAEEARARAEAAAAARRARDEQVAEEKAARKEEQARRRELILQQYKLKKAIEEAEREGKTLDKTEYIESIRAAGGVVPQQSAPSSGARLRHKPAAARARPKTIHVDSGALQAAEGMLASKQPSSTNLTAGGTMRRDYYRGSQDSLAERAGLYRGLTMIWKHSPVEERGATSPGSASSAPLGRRGSCKTSRERVEEPPARSRSRYGTYQNNFKAGRKSSSLMNLCDSGLGRATPPRRAASPGVRTLASPAGSGPGSGPGSLPGAIGKRRNNHSDDNSDASSQHSSIMDYSGPRLYKQPATKSNRGIMLNAVEYCVFPGAVNAEAKRRVLEEIARSESKHFLVLFRDAGCQFRALYSYCPDSEQVTKLYGTGPKHVNDRMFDKFFKYNSGSKCFSQVHTKHLTVTIDAFTIHNSLWQGKKVQLPSKKDMALVI
ncbi:patronin isoform X10 [Plutella xylostella]|uniref:patronin isoform X10 n=1 Tax=Plutella xylostella TaxID=51655 RepID=UPI00203238C4|nr:patronin isoform X10 [Plutella xylostella]